MKCEKINTYYVIMLQTIVEKNGDEAGRRRNKIQ